MNRKGDRRFPLVTQRWLSILVFVGVLPLPVVALAFGVYLITSGMTGDHAGPIPGSQITLFLTAMLVAGVGGFLIWRTLSLLGHPGDAPSPVTTPDEVPADRPAEDAPFTNSVARMLATIERQAGELVQFDRRLENANRELEAARARLHETSVTDEPTGVYTRRFFVTRLAEEVSRFHRLGHPVSLVLVGLDGFGIAGPRVAPRERDEMLREVARVLLESSRDIDVVGRHDEDELAVMLVETEGAGAELYAARIRDSLAAAFFTRGRPLAASLGVSSLPRDAATGDELLLAAEDALHMSRRTGEDRGAAWPGWTVGSMASREARRS
jgi:diguanylate cyclase (GGDEF)-like protein